MDWTEIAGAALALLFLRLEITGNWLMWPVSIASALLYMIIFYHAKVYAQVAISAYYVAISLYALFLWRFSHAAQQETGFTCYATPPKTVALLAGVALCMFIGLRLVLGQFTDSPVPTVDAFVASLSIVGTFMTAKKLLAHWYVWGVVNVASVALYGYLGLYPTAVLYVVYLGGVFYGLRHWKTRLHTPLHSPCAAG